MGIGKRQSWGLRSLAGLALIVAVAVAGLASCQPSVLVNQLTPRDGFEVQRDLAYGSDPRHRLDLYIPRSLPPNRAVVVFVHGGAWDSGDKQQYLFVGEAFTSLGYITAIPNYRLYPDVEFPAFVDDIARSIAALDRLLPSDACTDGLEVILVGHSAGAHTAAMLATAPQFLARNRADVDLRAWVGLAGPYDLPLDDPAVVGKFDNLSHPLEANPVALATRETPPTLLIHGEQDATVFLHHTIRLRARLEQLGVATTVKILPDTNHTRVIGSLARPLRFLNPAFADIAQFLQQAQLDRPCRVGHAVGGQESPNR